MTSIYSNASNSVAPLGIVPVTNVAVQKGCSTESTSNSIKIKRQGVYRVTAMVTDVVTGGGIGEFAILVNGVEIPYLVASSYSNTGEPSTITIVGEIVVNPNCPAITTNLPSIITIQNVGTTTALVSFAKLDVVKEN